MIRCSRRIWSVLYWVLPSFFDLKTQRSVYYTHAWFMLGWAFSESGKRGQFVKLYVVIVHEFTRKSEAWHGMVWYARSLWRMSGRRSVQTSTG